ncbi:MAG: hypothetical protein EXR86_15770 [Gammaproteobacteria bacterium]|nr:hypothetical protein [Gammaproteobacteria bacterium]
MAKRTGTALADLLIGTLDDDVLLGLAGDDTLQGGAGADRLYGGAGADLLEGGAGNDPFTFDEHDTVIGGGGLDTVRVTGPGRALNLRAIPPERLTGIDVIELAGTDRDVLSLNAARVRALSETHQLRVEGDDGDYIVAEYGWRGRGTVVIAGETYERFTKDGATLLVDPSLTFDFGIDLRTLNSSRGVEFEGFNRLDSLGESVAVVGDVNGDGFDDFVLGVYGGDGIAESRTDAGESYVIFGKANGLDNVDLASLESGQGFRIIGASFSDRAGQEVSAAGDVNGDGFDDILIGAGHADGVDELRGGSGETYVIFGHRAGFSTIDLGTMSSARGIRIYGEHPADSSGSVLSNAGDINGDGFADLLIGASGVDGARGTYSGAAYVVFGSADGLTDLGLAALPADNGFRIGSGGSVSVGGALAGVGDFNGDGFDEFVIGDPSDPTTAGKGSVHVRHSRQTGGLQRSGSRQSKRNSNIRYFEGESLE